MNVMQLRFYAVIWAMGAVVLGCQSQDGQYAATVSLQQQADSQRRSIYDEVELLAGSGAEEDQPIEPDAAQPYEPEPEEEAILEERVEQAMSVADDSPLCGNGELDDLELCDPLILEGEGACPERCDPPPGCPDETLVISGCSTHCMAEDEPSEECLDAM